MVTGALQPGYDRTSKEALMTASTLSDLYRPSHDEAAKQRFVGVLKGYANQTLEQQLAEHYARDLELYLIDHGLDEMGESTGEKGEPQLVVRCAFEDFGKVQLALEERKISPISAEHEYIPTAPVELPEAQAAEVLALVDKLEQDDDVQSVFHTLG